MMLGIILVLLMGTIALIAFILTKYKKEIWETIEFKDDGGDTIERRRKLNTFE